MNTGLKIVGGVVVGVVLIAAGVFAGVVVARAQRPATVLSPVGPVGPGMMVPGGYAGQYNTQMQAAIASALGITTDELTKDLQAGQTPWQIAQAKGMTADQFNQAMVKAMGDVLAQAVKDGTLTQAQADAMLARMKQYPGMGFGMGYGYGMGPGMMGRGRDFDDGRGRGYGRGMGPGFGPRTSPQTQPTPTPSGSSS
jgi:hypothetical protein